MFFITGDKHGDFGDVIEFCIDYETTVDDMWGQR